MTQLTMLMVCTHCDKPILDKWVNLLLLLLLLLLLPLPITLPRRTPVRGILKSRPVTPDTSSFMGDMSKELAERALNIINPSRK